MIRVDGKDAPPRPSPICTRGPRTLGTLLCMICTLGACIMCTPDSCTLEELPLAMVAHSNFFYSQNTS